jgi:hypothetical protein
MAMLTAIPYVASSLGDAGIHALNMAAEAAAQTAVNLSGIPLVRAIFMLTLLVLSLISSHLI